MAITIPVTNDPSSKFTIDLDTQECQFNIRWSVASNVWILNFQDLTASRTYNGLRLLSGVDLFKPLAMPLLGSLYVIDLEGQNLDPDFDNFGDRYQLIYVGVDETL